MPHIFISQKLFVRDEVDLSLLEPLLSLGELGVQYCLKSPKSFEHLTEAESRIQKIDYLDYNTKYNERDARAREKMRELVDSEENSLTTVFSSLVQEV